MGLERIVDTLEESAFVRRFAGSDAVVLVLVYVDDMLIAGPREHAIVVHHRVAAKFGAGQVPNFHLSSFIGVQRNELPPMGESRRLFIHQSDYAKW